MTVVVGQDTAKTRRTLTVGDESIGYYSIPAAQAAGLGDFSRLPAALKVVLENMLRFEDGKTVSVDDIKAFAQWGAQGGKNPREIAYRPARVLMQDFTGVPAVVDLAAMRDGIVALGGDPEKINPLNPVDLVIDHSVMIDEFGTPHAFQMNVDREYERNMERYTFLKWGQSAFNNFRVVPPGTGICHQVNLEYLSQTVWTDVDQNGEQVAYPDTLVGTDSHTTMVNGAAVLGWGVGGIEAEAAMLGQPISMLIPEVVGFELTGAMMEGTKEMIQNALWNTWFAAPCAANATALPIRPTQNTSTAPTSGMIRKFNIAGMKSFRICLSIASFAGNASFQKFTLVLSVAVTMGSSAGTTIAAAAGRGVALSATRRRIAVPFAEEKGTEDVGTFTCNRALRGAVSRERGAPTRALTATRAPPMRALTADIIVIGYARANERPSGVRACASERDGATPRRLDSWTMTWLTFTAQKTQDRGHFL